MYVPVTLTIQSAAFQRIAGCLSGGCGPLVAAESPGDGRIDAHDDKPGTLLPPLQGLICAQTRIPTAKAVGYLKGAGSADPRTTDKKKCHRRLIHALSSAWSLSTVAQFRVVTSSRRSRWTAASSLLSRMPSAHQR
jgi:hypothetical protein